MKQSINEYQFRDAFMSIRPDNFSYEGLGVLFDYLEQLGDDIGEEIELDVIAICCDYSEMSYDDIVDEYIRHDDTAWEDIRDEKDEGDRNEYILEWLQDRTQVITVDDDTVIIQQF